MLNAIKQSVFIPKVVLLSVFRLGMVLSHILRSGSGWTFPNIWKVQPWSVLETKIWIQHHLS
jgi:hypothetical protein